MAVPTVEYDRFGVSYDDMSPMEASGYELLVVEDGHFTKNEVAKLKEEVRYLAAYISLGEVNSNLWYFPDLKKRGFLGFNRNWNTYYLNLADTVTRDLLANEAVPRLVEKGYNAIFLDTIDDVAPYTERSHLQPDMVKLIASIDRKYPDLLLIQNAGLFLLDQTKEYVDAVIVESVASSFNFEDREYRLKREELYRQKVNRLVRYSIESGLPFFIIDFARMPDLRKQVRARLDTLPFPYYISVIELDTLPPAETVQGAFN